MEEELQLGNSMSNQPSSIIDVAAIRRDFPVLHQDVFPGVPLVYLDNAATAQKPLAVIEAVRHYYLADNANIHRGIHALAERATTDYENARLKIAKFIGATSSSEIIFVRNTTEAINLVTHSWGRVNLGAGDEILLTELEHHSNLVPWQMLAQERGVIIRYVPVSGDCCLDLDRYDALLTERTKLVSFTGMSNVLGAITPARQIIDKAHQAGAVVLMDGAQSVPHLPTDVQTLDVDFLAFSGHKMCGPTGIGVLYGKRALLEAMPPFLGGGDMIRRVTFDGAEWNELPWKFEAGTPSIAQAIGLGAAVDYLDIVGMDNVEAYEHAIADYALEALSEVKGVSALGPPAVERGAVIAFTVADMHPHDVAELLNRDGVAVRAGHHCAMPLHQKLGLPATSRASFYLYNTFDEVDRLVAALRRAQKIFGLA
jgi:cysteine desulfurase / selenocysteine lyase